MDLQELLGKIREKLKAENVTEPKEDDVLRVLSGLDQENKLTDEFIGDDEKLGAWMDDVLGAFFKPD